MLPMKRSESAVQDKHPELHGGYATLLKKKSCPSIKDTYYLSSVKNHLHQSTTIAQTTYKLSSEYSW